MITKERTNSVKRLTRAIKINDAKGDQLRRELVRELQGAMKEGAKGSELAKIVGVSRQRIHQLVKGS